MLKPVLLAISRLILFAVICLCINTSWVVDVLNMSPSQSHKDTRSEYSPFPPPIRRGILDYRLFIVHNSQLPLFESITPLESLKKYRAGCVFEEFMSAILRE